MSLLPKVAGQSVAGAGAGMVPPVMTLCLYVWHLTHEDSPGTRSHQAPRPPNGILNPLPGRSSCDSKPRVGVGTSKESEEVRSGI